MRDILKLLAHKGWAVLSGETKEINLIMNWQFLSARVFNLRATVMVGTLLISGTCVNAQDTKSPLLTALEGADTELGKHLDDHELLEAEIAKLEQLFAKFRGAHNPEFFKSQVSQLTVTLNDRGQDSTVSSAVTELKALETALSAKLVTLDKDFRIGQLGDLVSAVSNVAENDAGWTPNTVSSLDALSDQIDRALVNHRNEQRIHIISAAYGDFRSGTPRNLRCNATQNIRTACNAQKTCVLAKPISQTACGYDPATVSLDENKSFKVTYACLVRSDAEWQDLIARRTKIRESDVAHLHLTTGVQSPVLSCEPGPPAAVGGEAVIVRQIGLLTDSVELLTERGITGATVDGLNAEIGKLQAELADLHKTGGG